MAQQQFFDQIPAYLDGELSSESRKAFEANLQQDSELAAEVALARDTRQLLSLATQSAYKERLRAIDAEMTAAPAPVIRPLWQRSWVQAAAAAVVVLLISSVFLLRQGPSPSDVGEAAFSPYMDMLSYKGSPALGEDSLILAAMYAYNTQAYEAAISTFDQVLAANPTQVPARFYQAQSYLAVNKPLPALAILEQLPPDGPLAEASQWYIAIAWLMQGNSSNARPLLQSMADDPGHGFQLKAERLLEQL